VNLAFALDRPRRLLRDLFTNRAQPDLAALAAIEDPQRFVWAILPHAARTFSSTIGLLPRPLAEASAVGYLYCRMLDTYEDLVPDASEREEALTTFATRLETGAPAPRIRADLALDPRDEAHLLLVRRCALVDQAYARLAAPAQALIRTLVAEMAEGMRWASQTFAAQGGVLESEAQLGRYCHYVLGEPVLFAARLLAQQQGSAAPLSPDTEADARAVGTLIQLANVTRDIEKDLARGVGYHPALRDDLGAQPTDDPAQTERIRSVRAELLDHALSHAPAYRRLVDALTPRGFRMARASALLMFLFTDRYFSGCAVRVGRPAWVKRHSSARLILTALPAAVSRRWADRRLRRIEARFLKAPTGP
jgi:phytoene/squalene synthetase